MISAASCYVNWQKNIKLADIDRNWFQFSKVDAVIDEGLQSLGKMIENHKEEDEDTFNGYDIYEVYGIDILISGSKYYR